MMDIITISSDDQKSPEQGPSRSSEAKKRGTIPLKDEWTEESDLDLHAAFSDKRVKRGKGESHARARTDKSARGQSSRRRPRKRAPREVRDGDDSAREEEAEVAPEDLLPDNIRQRRHDFDRNWARFKQWVKSNEGVPLNQQMEHLKRTALRLPPDYHEIYFSDDEKRSRPEKPVFDKRSGIKPSQERKDIVMRHTLGCIPAPIAQYLRDYQIEGVEFLHEHFVDQMGCILGDDMGLGKTIQVAAFLTVVFGKTGDIRDSKRMRKYRRNFSNKRWYPRVLIICLVSLISNWRNELQRWGWWTTEVYQGSKKNRQNIMDCAQSGRLEVMLTTYSTYRNHADEINMVEWDVVIADECHAIKDDSAEVTRAMNEVNTLCRIGLTGTAIQNNYYELWTLLNWTNPGVLGTKNEWKLTICEPLKAGQAHDATGEELSRARKTAKNLATNLLPRFFLRRMKSLIAHQLPKKTDTVVFCPLSERQRVAYKTFLQSDLVRLVRGGSEVGCRCGVPPRPSCYWHTNVLEPGETWMSVVFPVIISLQKMANHLMLLAPQGMESTEKQGRDLRYIKAAMPEEWRHLYTNRESILHLSNPTFCGKWEILKRLLHLWHQGGHKVLVFSHSVRLLKILQILFSKTSYTVSYLDGSLKSEERQTAVDEFNTDPSRFVFLISTKSGGVGLNITSANKVVIMDPHWNPSYDLQAQDRAYRIGQTRDVEVYRLVSAGTIEEVTYARQIYKQQQANIGYTASNERRYFTGVQDTGRQGDIFGIENLTTYRGDQVMLRDIVNKTNVAEAKVGIRMMTIDIDNVIEEAAENQVIKKEGDGDEDGGLSQLAAVITQGEKKAPAARSKASAPKTDAVQAILASAGVEYMHENSEVVGSSRVEQHLSRRAQLEAGRETVQFRQSVFHDGSRDAMVQGPDGDISRFNFRYNPPEDVMHRQFCTMSKTLGHGSAVEFALAVGAMTQEERRDCLDGFYRKRMEWLREMGDVKEEVKDKVKDEVKEEKKDAVVKIPKEEQDQPELKVEASELAGCQVKPDPAVDRSGGVKREEHGGKPVFWCLDDDGDDEL